MESKHDITELLHEDFLALFGNDDFVQETGWSPALTACDRRISFVLTWTPFADTQTVTPYNEVWQGEELKDVSTRGQDLDTSATIPVPTWGRQEEDSTDPSLCGLYKDASAVSTAPAVCVLEDVCPKFHKIAPLEQIENLQPGVQENTDETLEAVCPTVMRCPEGEAPPEVTPSEEIEMLASGAQGNMEDELSVDMQKKQTFPPSPASPVASKTAMGLIQPPDPFPYQNTPGPKQPETSTDDPSKPFACEICSRRFGQKQHLKRHYKSLHTGEKPFECDICGKRFSRADTLSQHRSTHSSAPSEFLLTIAFSGMSS
jgi:hypothetical protein